MEPGGTVAAEDAVGTGFRRYENHGFLKTGSFLLLEKIFIFINRRRRFVGSEASACSILFISSILMTYNCLSLFSGVLRPFKFFLSFPILQSVLNIFFIPCRVRTDGGF